MLCAEAKGKGEREAGERDGGMTRHGRPLRASNLGGKGGKLYVSYQTEYSRRSGKGYIVVGGEKERVEVPAPVPGGGSGR